MPFPSIFDRWGIFTVRFIVGRTLSRCAEGVGGKFLTQCFGCTISQYAAAVALIKHNKREHFKSMKSKDIQYLNNLTNGSQYPAAGCAMGEKIYMYHHSLSGAVESMNRANSKTRARTAVDLPNATILLLKLECTQFNKMKQEAWGGNSILTPRGKEEYKATFTNLNPSHFLFHLRDKDGHWQLRVF